MGKKKTQPESDAVATEAGSPEAVAPADEAVEAPRPSSKATVDVFDKDGAFVRTYSKAIHGDSFREYANEYAAKIGGKVK